MLSTLFLGLVAISIALLRPRRRGAGGLAGVSRLGDWPAPFVYRVRRGRLLPSYYYSRVSWL